MLEGTTRSFPSDLGVVEGGAPPVLHRRSYIDVAPSVPTVMVANGCLVCVSAAPDGRSRISSVRAGALKGFATLVFASRVKLRLGFRKTKCPSQLKHYGLRLALRLRKFRSILSVFAAMGSNSAGTSSSGWANAGNAVIAWQRPWRWPWV